MQIRSEHSSGTPDLCGLEFFIFASTRGHDIKGASSHDGKDEVDMPRVIPSNIRDEELLFDRREQIVTAAISVFLEKGYHVATTRDVATQAGITQSNLYNYISSKSDILLLACQRLVGLYLGKLHTVESLYTDPRVLLTESLRQIISVMYEHRQELRLLYNEVHSLGASDRKLIMASIAKLNTNFQSMITRYEREVGPLRLPNRRLAANIISFVPTILSLRAWDLAPYVKRSEQEEGILDFILAGLGVEPVHEANLQINENRGEGI